MWQEGRSLLLVKERSVADGGRAANGRWTTINNMIYRFIAPNNIAGGGAGCRPAAAVVVMVHGVKNAHVHRLYLETCTHRRRPAGRWTDGRAGWCENGGK